ncbi:glycosyltransferase family 4 protein [bacterium]|nr:glycosyltransferase family 4 protein [bacterium]
MRIALIARGCRPGAGIELYTHELANRLSTRHEVTVLTDPNEVLGCQAEVVPVKAPRRPLWHSISAFSTKAGFLAQTSRYDVVHTQGSDGRWGDVVTAHSCHLAGMRASLKQNSSFNNKLRKFFSPAHRAVLNMERNAFFSARRMIAVSKRVKRQIRSAYPDTRNIPIEVIYPGVDIQTYSPAKLALTRMAIRKRYGFRENQVVFILVANMPQLKGAVRLIQALRLLKNPDAHLMIASGSGRHRDLMKLVKRNCLEKQVHFVAAGQNAFQVYAAGDVYAALPEYESFGLTILEAMACGLPVLLTNNAGAAELMTPGLEGFVFPARVDDQTVANAMDCLVRDVDVRRQMGIQARLCAQQHTWDKMIHQVEQVYAKLLSEKR